jgi:hypothetical protein
LATKTKKVGRPKSEDPKVKNIQVRFTEVEYAKIKGCADQNDLSITQLVRQGIYMIVDSLK